MNKLKTIFHKFLHKEDGQGISEYGALLAFISILVALVFAFAPGKLAPAVSQAFSSMAQELNDSAAGAGSASGS